MSSDDQAGSSTNTVIIVVAIVGVVILLILLACGGLIFLGARAFSQAMATAMQQITEMQASQTLAQSFLDDVGNGRLDEAYAETSQGFRQRTTREQFGALVEKYPALKGASGMPQPSSAMTPTAATFTVALSGPNGSVTVTVHTVKEGTQWKVDRFAPLSEDAGPSKEKAPPKGKAPKAGGPDKAKDVPPPD
jgi:hypothetical protein